MSPAAVDLIPLPPLDPPAPPPPSAPRNGPSFSDHLQQAERRSGEPDASRRESKAEERDATQSNSGTTEARGPKETSEADKPQEKGSDKKAENSETVAASKEKKQDGDADEDKKSKDETGVEGVVAPIVVPQEVDPTTMLKTDVVEVTAEAVAAVDAIPAAAQVAVNEAAKTAAEAAAIVVQAAATITVEDEPKVVAATAETVSEAATELVPQVVAAETTVVEPTKAVAAAKQTPVNELSATTQVPAAPVVVPTAAAAASAAAQTVETKDGETAKSDEKSEVKATDSVSAATPTVDAVVQQVVAAAEAAIDSAAGNSDDQSPRHDKDKQHDGTRVEGHKETTRIDRPHLTETNRATNGRETAGTGTATNDGSSHLSQADRVRLVERVARAVRTAEARGGDLKIRLSPPELGSLRLQVKLTDGTLTARIEAETPEARQVLVDNLPQLREKLSDQNIRVEKFDIDLFNSGYGGAPQNSREDFDQAMFAAGQRRSNRDRAGDDQSNGGGSAPRSSRNTLGRSDGRLDITV